MKIRLARKIMKQQPDNYLPLRKISLYWLCAWNRYYNYVYPSSLGNGKADHRITKAISLTSKRMKQFDYDKP